MTPRLGALAVVLKDGQVLLAQRKKAPDAGLWGFPGGHVEWGETVGEAAARELLEETGVRAKPGCHLATLDLIKRGPDQSVITHYLLVAVQCEYLSGTPRAVSEIADARWVSVDAVRKDALAMSERVGFVLEKALNAGSGLSPNT